MMMAHREAIQEERKALNEEIDSGEASKTSKDHQGTEIPPVSQKKSDEHDNKDSDISRTEDCSLERQLDRGEKRLPDNDEKGGEKDNNSKEVDVTRSRGEKRLPDNDEKVSEKDNSSKVAEVTRRRDYSHERLRAFQHQRCSLRVSVSNIAAMSGYHPWKNLPELLMELVYQGRVGKALLRKDASLLGLKLVSQDDILLGLAEKASRSTREALQSALKVKDGSKKVETVESARNVKQKVLEEAKKTGKLAAKELKILEEGARSAVDTGYGTAHEDAALNVYEQRCGEQVRERNAEIRIWPFELAPDDDNEVVEPTVVPVGKARPLYLTATCSRKSDSDDGNSDEQESSTNVKRQKVIDLTDNGESNQTDRPGKDPGKTVSSTNEDSVPFFSILGSVDGIRDEIVPVVNQKEEESTADYSFDQDSWVVRPIIVECKHRMKRIHSTPPLYEQIQAAAYCLMYETDEADIIQVMRREASSKAKRKSNKKNKNKEPPPRIQTLDKWVQRESNETEEARSTLEESTEKQTETPQTEPTIFVSRVSLDDPIMQHRQQWKQVVLPRLRSFVETVYSIRSDDDKRYQLLVSASDPTGNMEGAWKLLHQECPWLEACDTAFHRS